MQITWRFSPLKNPVYITDAEYKLGVRRGVEMISRYFNVDCRELPAVAGTPANLLFIVSPWPYPTGLDATAWTDRYGQWGYRVPAIYISGTQPMGSAIRMRYIIAHELGHWFGAQHHAGRNIMDINLPAVGTWSPDDYTQLRRTLPPRVKAPLPWNDLSYWAGK